MDVRCGWRWLGGTHVMCLRDQNTHLMNVRAESGSGGVARTPSFESPIKVVLSSLNYAESLGLVSNTHTHTLSEVLLSVVTEVLFPFFF